MNGEVKDFTGGRVRVAKCWIKVDLECFLFPFVSDFFFKRILLNEVREELKGGSLWNRLQVGQEGDKEAHSPEPPI